MKVLVLGGAGFVGREVVRQLAEQPNLEPVIGSRRPGTKDGVEIISVDALNIDALTPVLANVDALINCITGDGHAIEQSTKNIVTAVKASARCNLLVHMSTMSVYGNQEARVNERSDMVADIGWYGAAKVAAEQTLHSQLEDGVYILRPGCVYGPDSHLWTTRIAKLLAAGRLGDLAEYGDGWSNLVHVNDVAQAAVNCLLRSEHAGIRTFNLAAPDSPRWNQYFRDFALGIDATPVKYFSKKRISLEGKVIAPPLKVLERLGNKFRLNLDKLPDGMPPSLFRLWQQQIFLDSTAASEDLGVRWVTYQDGLEQSCQYITGMLQS